MKGFKTGLKAGKQTVDKCTKELEALKETLKAEEEKELATQEAIAAVDRLVLMAQTAAAAKAAEKTAAEMPQEAASEEAAPAETAPEEMVTAKAVSEVMEDAQPQEAIVEEVVMAEVDSVKATEDLEPPAKRLRTEEMMASPAKKLEAQVASPARVRVSTS